MITVKRDGYIVEIYSNTQYEDYISINIYKPRWFFGKQFLLNLYIKREQDAKLKEYVAYAIKEVKDLYG